MNTIRFPLNAEKETLSLLKTYSKTPSELIEISLPNTTVKALKIVTMDYTLYIKVTKALEAELLRIGRELMTEFGQIPLKDTKQMPTISVTLDKTAIVKLAFDWDKLVNFKHKATGWYVREDEEIVIDFFSLG